MLDGRYTTKYLGSEGQADVHVRAAGLEAAAGPVRPLRGLLQAAERLPFPQDPRRWPRLLRRLPSPSAQLPQIPPHRDRAHYPRNLRVPDRIGSTVRGGARGPLRIPRCFGPDSLCRAIRPGLVDISLGGWGKFPCSCRFRLQWARFLLPWG